MYFTYIIYIYMMSVTKYRPSIFEAFIYFRNLLKKAIEADCNLAEYLHYCKDYLYYIYYLKITIIWRIVYLLISRYSVLATLLYVYLLMEISKVAVFSKYPT